MRLCVCCLCLFSLLMNVWLFSVCLTLVLILGGFALLVCVVLNLFWRCFVWGLFSLVVLVVELSVWFIALWFCYLF